MGKKTSAKKAVAKKTPNKGTAVKKTMDKKAVTKKSLTRGVTVKKARIIRSRGDVKISRQKVLLSKEMQRLGITEEDLAKVDEEFGIPA